MNHLFKGVINPQVPHTKALFALINHLNQRVEYQHSAQQQDINVDSSIPQTSQENPCIALST